jgi:hypothetical protein
MSVQTKPRGKTAGKPLSELTRFKIMWRDSMAEVTRDYWRLRWLSEDTQAQVRKEIFTKLKIHLTYDRQLNEMRDWDFEQRERDLESERMADDERRSLEDHPDWTKEQAREDVLRKSYMRVRATGDFKLGLATVDRDLKGQVVAQDERKLKLLEKKAAQSDATEKVLSDADLTPAERTQRIKEIYGR